MTSLIAADGLGRSARAIPAVPAAWSVTTIAFMGLSPVSGIGWVERSSVVRAGRGAELSLPVVAGRGRARVAGSGGGDRGGEQGEPAVSEGDLWEGERVGEPSGDEAGN